MPPVSSRTPYRTLLLRALRLRCPRCGRGKLYQRPFRMYAHCPECGLNYDREPGFYLGSIYVNYGATALLTTILYFIGFNQGVSPNWLLGGLMVFCLLFPLAMFSHARAVWLAFDQFWDPQEEGPAPATRADQSAQIPVDGTNERSGS